MNPLLAQFVDESAELLDRCNEGLLRLEQDPQDRAAVDALFRAMHTLKGNSGLFDFPELTEVLHAAEDVMEALRLGRLQYQPSLGDLVFHLLDVVRQGVADIRVEQKPTAVIAQATALITALKGWLPQGAAEADSIQHEPSAVPEELQLVLPFAAQTALWPVFETVDTLWYIAYRPQPDTFYHGEDPFWHARRTPGVVWGTIVAPRSWPALENFDLYRCVLEFHLVSQAAQADIAHHFQFQRDSVRLCALDRWRLADLGGAEALTAMAGARREALVSLLQRGAWEEWERWLAEEPDASGPAAWFRGFAQAGQQDPDRLRAAVRHWAVSLGLETCVGTEEKPGGLPPSAASRPQEDLGRHDAVMPSTATIRVPAAKIDRLMALVGELVVAKNGLPYLAKKATSEYGAEPLARELRAQYAAIHRIVEDLKMAVFDVRMVPLSTVFQRFPRLVRDLARKLGKQVTLSVVGGETEIDKGVAEILAEPLMHLIRNSLDHGIEPPEERERLGKRVPAELRLSAWYEGDTVIVEVSDDGRGLDSDRIKQRAQEKGIMTASDLARLSERDAWHLIFHPGFSTVDRVSDVSGRGVGMDVVKQVVERSGGRVALDSHKNQGLRVRLMLPLAMMSRRVMVVELGDQPFGVPIEHIVEVVRCAPDGQQSLGQRATLVWRGRSIPLVNLGEMFHTIPGPRLNGFGECAVLVGRVDDAEVGLIVDGFRETVDVIVTPLEGPLAQLSVYEGSALLGDGSVLLVLNLRELIQWQWS
ncbi:MAG: chemotaxis protein CheA [Firmicutes bacterium]|nr:chemotaxis protein CheA [Bacillota bacterium]